MSNDVSKSNSRSKEFLLFCSFTSIILGLILINHKIDDEATLPRNTKVFGIVTKVFKNSKKDNMYEISFLHLNDTLKIHNHKRPTKRKFVLNQKVEVVYNSKQLELARLNFPEELEKSINDPIIWILFVASCLSFVYFLIMVIAEERY